MTLTCLVAAALAHGVCDRGHSRPLPAVVTETICPDDPDDFLKASPGRLSGDALNLCESDDVYLSCRWWTRDPPLLPPVELWVWAETSLDPQTVESIEYTLEMRVTAIVHGGQRPDTLQTSILNLMNPPRWELVDVRATDPFIDEIVTFAQETNAPDYIDPDNGRITVRMRVFSPGRLVMADWWLRVDLYEVTVTSAE